MILLDTQVLYWSIVGSDRIGGHTRQLLSSATHRYVSAITHVELAIKQMKGKLHLPPDLLERLEAAGYEGLPFDERHANGLRNLKELSGHDPFDRMLLAQARVEGLVLVTSDRHLLSFEGTADAAR